MKHSFMLGAMRCVYVDLDGTLLGAEASFLRDGDGNFSLLGARALEACSRAGVEVVIYSGRRQHQADLDLSDAKWLEKPAAHHDILTALARLMGPSCP